MTDTWSRSPWLDRRGVGDRQASVRGEEPAACQKACPPTHNSPTPPHSPSPPEGMSWCVFMPADDSSRWADGVCVCVVKMRPVDYMQAYRAAAKKWDDHTWREQATMHESTDREALTCMLTANQPVMVSVSYDEKHRSTDIILKLLLSYCTCWSLWVWILALKILINYQKLDVMD